jgi:hypothetical protein
MTGVRTLFALAAGAVPDGDDVPGEPLLLEKVDTPEGMALNLTWGSSCVANDISYAVYEGILGAFGTHVPVTCSTSDALNYQLAPLEGNDTYYLVVPWSPPDGQGFFPAEGSYGRTSEGVERVQNIQYACMQQAFGGCP